MDPNLDLTGAVLTDSRELKVIFFGEVNFDYSNPEINAIKKKQVIFGSCGEELICVLQYRKRGLLRGDLWLARIISLTGTTSEWEGGNLYFPPYGRDRTFLGSVRPA
jgi:hypothetical protein